MKPKLSEHAARLAQLARGLDRIADGFYHPLQASEEVELDELFRAFNNMAHILAVRDQSTREQNVYLAAAVSRIEKLLDASIDGIALIDQEGSFEFVNRRFCEILGLQAGSLHKKSIEQATTSWENSVKNSTRLLRVLKPSPHDGADGSQDVVDDVVELKTADPRFAQVYGAPVFDDDGVYAGRIISLHDNTREMELDRLKTEFISVVSHELRTPLTSILGYTDLMLSGATGEINEIQREFLGILQSSGNRLGNLINDILDLSRIDAGRMEVKHEPVNYSTIIGELLRLMKSSADAKDIALDVSFPQNLPLVSGDSDKITQVVANLLSNAIKYTPEGGWIKVLIETTEDTTIKTCIADSGIGISEEDQNRLFQKFFRADNSLTREAGGTGLGLVIVKSIIELLGGSIWVQSEIGRGSKFFFTLPISDNNTVAGPDGAVGAPAMSLPFLDRGLALVLVVDDGSYIREAIQHGLHRRGYGVVTAGSPEDAVQKARQHKPDVAIINTIMDRCRGFDVLKALRRDPATATLPIIASSVQGDASGDAVALGAVSFVNSPADLTDVARALDIHVASMNDRAILIVTFEQEQAEAASTVKQTLADSGFFASIVTGASEAVTSVVQSAPIAIVIEAVSTDNSEMRSLLTALKSEQEFARIPLIIRTGEYSSTGIHMHIGGSGVDVRSTVDYILEQIIEVLRAKTYSMSSIASDDDGATSGILSTN
jgi:signal transduction histidine kinase/CheY-like chemotaxis protein